MKSIHKVHDNCAKAIFGEPLLVAQLLQDFLNIDILKDIDPTDIQDVTERFVTLEAEQKDSDTIKRINIKGDRPLFVLTTRIKG